MASIGDEPPKNQGDGFDHEENVQDEAKEASSPSAANSGKIISLARAQVSKKSFFNKKTPEDHREQAEKINAMRKRLIRAKNGGDEAYNKKPDPSFEKRIEAPLPELPRVSMSSFIAASGLASLRLAILLVYLILIFSIYRMLLAYQPSDHFIYAPADILASIRILGVSVPRVVIEYHTLQIAVPIILIILQILSPFITLGAIPTYKNPFWYYLKPRIKFKDRSFVGKILFLLVVWPCFVIFSLTKVLWHFFMVIFFVLPAPLLMLTALEFLPNATNESSQLIDIASYGLLTAMILGLFVIIRARPTKQILVTLPLFIILIFPFVPIWHLTKGPLDRGDINPVLLNLEVVLCRVMTAGDSVVKNEDNQNIDPCYPESGFSPAGDYLFAYPVATEQGLPLSYFEAFILNDDLVNAVATQTDLPLSYFTVSRNFYLIRHDIIDLSNVDFRGSSFVIRDFRGANLAGAQFGCPSELIEGLNFNLYGCTALDGADFSGANLTGASFERISLQNAQFSNVKAMEATFSQVNMNGANIDLTNLDRSTLYWVSLIGASLEAALLNNAMFDKVDLTDASMHRVEAVASTFNNVTFSGADLALSNLSRSSMSNVNLNATLLVDADLSKAYIGDSSFIETLMTGTNLNQTVIKNTN